MLTCVKVERSGFVKKWFCKEMGRPRLKFSPFSARKIGVIGDNILMVKSPGGYFIVTPSCG